MRSSKDQHLMSQNSRASGHQHESDFMVKRVELRPRVLGCTPVHCFRNPCRYNVGATDSADPGVSQYFPSFLFPLFMLIFFLPFPLFSSFNPAEKCNFTIGKSSQDLTLGESHDRARILSRTSDFWEERTNGKRRESVKTLSTGTNPLGSFREKQPHGSERNGAKPTHSLLPDAGASSRRSVRASVR